jgi:hypothetical protein
MGGAEEGDEGRGRGGEGRGVAGDESAEFGLAVAGEDGGEGVGEEHGGGKLEDRTASVTDRETLPATPHEPI